MENCGFQGMTRYEHEVLYSSFINHAKTQKSSKALGGTDNISLNFSD